MKKILSYKESGADQILLVNTFLVKNKIVLTNYHHEKRESLIF